MSGRLKANRSLELSQFPDEAQPRQKGYKLSKGSDWGGRGLGAKLTGTEDLLFKLAEVFGTEVTTVPVAISYTASQIHIFSIFSGGYSLSGNLWLCRWPLSPIVHWSWLEIGCVSRKDSHLHTVPKGGSTLAQGERNLAGGLSQILLLFSSSGSY